MIYILHEIVVDKKANDRFIEVWPEIRDFDADSIEDIIKTIESQMEICGFKSTDLEITAVTNIPNADKALQEGKVINIKIADKSGYVAMTKAAAENIPLADFLIKFSELNNGFSGAVAALKKEDYSLERTKIEYPDKTDEFSIPSIPAFNCTLGQYRDITNNPIELNSEQRNLLTVLSGIVKKEAEKGNNFVEYTLDGLVRVANGKGSDYTPGNGEKKRYALYMDILTDKVTIPLQDGALGVTQLVTAKYIKNILVNGNMTNVYRIYRVENIPTSQIIEYWKFSLPAGYAHNYENRRIREYIIDRSMDSANHKIDFEWLCRDLGIAKTNAKKRHDTKKKIEEMVTYYNLEGMQLITETGKKTKSSKL